MERVVVAREEGLAVAAAEAWVEADSVAAETEVARAVVGVAEAGWRRGGGGGGGVGGGGLAVAEAEVERVAAAGRRAGRWWRGWRRRRWWRGGGGEGGLGGGGAAVARVEAAREVGLAERCCLCRRPSQCSDREEVCTRCCQSPWPGNWQRSGSSIRAFRY